MNIFFAQALIIVSIVATSGCGIVIGNVKPVTEKSGDYEILSLDKHNPDWIRLTREEVAGEEGQESPNDNSDFAYQSRSTASIISLNSACRIRIEKSGHDLKDFTRELLLGIEDVTERHERQRMVKDVPALETTVKGTLNSEPMKLRTVVLRKGRCLYDLMFVSRPEHFGRQETDFEKFVASLEFD